MAHLFQKNEGGNYHVRFRYDGSYYSRSLKTKRPGVAKDRQLGVERMLNRLANNMMEMPPNVEPGAFIVSEGVVRQPNEKPTDTITLAGLADRYRSSQEHRLAASYLSSQKTHLSHLRKFLGTKADEDCARITPRDLDSFIEHRGRIREANTVVRERNTLLQFFPSLSFGPEKL